MRTDDAVTRVRARALSLPETYEDEPWGHPVFKVANNQMFATMNVHDGVVHVTFKLTPEERDVALQLPYVDIARYVGRYGWVTAQIRDDEALEAVLEWLLESYWLRAPAALRRAVEE